MKAMDFSSAPRTRATDEDLEYQIDLMFREYAAELKHMDDRKLRLSAEQKRSIRSYLRMGYRQAIKRYGNRQWEAQQLFASIETAADKYLKHSEGFGEELHVTVNFKTLQANVKLVLPEDMYDDYGQDEEEEGNETE